MTEVFIKRPPNFQEEVSIAGCFIQHEDKFLYLKRSKNKPQGGLWGVPAGKVEAGESPMQTVLREIQEETGLSFEENQLSYIDPFYLRCPDGHEFIFHAFQAPMIPQALNINLSEHDTHTWATYEEVIKLPLMGGAPRILELIREFPTF